MTATEPPIVRHGLRLGGRALLVTAAYAAAAVVILGTVFALRVLVSPGALKSFLAFVLVASLSAGLEPGTVKAAALGGARVADIPRTVFLAASFLKSLLATPILALVWAFADPSAALPMLALTPAVAFAGFAATDLRVLFDLEGRHGAAIGLKQGSLAGGVAVAGVGLALGLPLAGALVISTIGRLVLLTVAVDRPAAAGPGLWRQAAGQLADLRWLDLAAVSVVAAVGGSADRVIGLRWLTAADYAGYYLVFELLSKFWLIPYVLAPILFARQAAGDDARAFVRGAWLLTALAGVAFLAVVAVILAASPAAPAQWLGAPFGWAIWLFAAAVTVNSFAQLRLSQLQGEGRGRRATVGAIAGAAAGIALFYAGARWFGAPGLLAAWLVKSALELILLSDPPGGSRRAAKVGP